MKMTGIDDIVVQFVCGAGNGGLRIPLPLECQTSSGFQAYCSTSASGMNLSDRSNDAFNDYIIIN